MAGTRFGHWPLLLVATIGLAGCEQSALRDGAEPLPAQARGQRVSERDIEAPELFEANENGLWDGRPSLGGVWVAHPDVTDPQRVLIRNAATGKTIIGALFRRERANPGPRIQLSSDAAEELGILAGQPTMLNVVALKREEVIEPAADMPISEETPGAGGAGEAPVDGGDVAAATAAATTATAVTGAEPQPVPEDAPPTSLGRRRTPPAAAEPAAAVETAPAPAAAAPATAAPAAAAPVAAGIPDAGAEPQPVPEDAPPTSFGRRAAPAGAAGAVAAPGALADGDVSVAPLGGAAPAPAAAPLDRPYIQAAIFGSEQNANAVAESLRGAGLAASVRRTDVGGTIYWRVIAGPAASAAERAEILGKVKDLGYSDAYPVRG